MHALNYSDIHAALMLIIFLYCKINNNINKNYLSVIQVINIHYWVLQLKEGVTISHVLIIYLLPPPNVT